MTQLRFLFFVIGLGILTACQHPYSHHTYATWWPRTLSRLPVNGGEPEVLVPDSVFEFLAIDHKRETIYAAGELSVGSLTLEGAPLGGFVVPNHVLAMALDAPGGHLYLAEEDEPRNIVRTDLAGEHWTVIVPKAGYCPALAFDATHQKLYRAQMNPTGLLQMNADGTGPVQVVNEVYAPMAIAVDDKHGVLIWACPDESDASSRISRARLDGSAPVRILENLPRNVEALAVDPVARRIFWIEREASASHPAGRIRSADYDGKDRKTHQTFKDGNFAVALVPGWLPKKRK